LAVTRVVIVFAAGFANPSRVIGIL
jgi:hypothetical protein